MSADKTVRITNYSNVFVEYGATAVAIKPGMLLEVISTGKVQAHSTSGGFAIPRFANEDEHQGKGIDTDYAASDTIPLVWFPGRGDIVNALLANGESVVIGDKLVSNGDGYLKKFVADIYVSSGLDTEEYILGEATEAVDMSDSSGADPSDRLNIRIN
jgi:hypothetical protein